MMEQMWNDILERFGQDVTLRGAKGDVSVKALVQPCLERNRGQEVPGPLGLERRERFRYMGPARYPLDMDTVVEWKNQAYRVQSTHLVGEGVCAHWWAILCPREEAAA